jgi:hypothetical protein
MIIYFIKYVDLNNGQTVGLPDDGTLDRYEFFAKEKDARKRAVELKKIQDEYTIPEDGDLRAPTMIYKIGFRTRLELIEQLNKLNMYPGP